ncbi:MAG: filamentous hemagglutinin N-terminal domain-containing protein [Leptolyngbyaceae cyanobacterium bins.302]|nr:filamentous hemagglutinin N-terminal domain-containing protein [Leptolyngbyaceae cyanobacterium bins.302]
MAKHGVAVRSRLFLLTAIFSSVLSPSLAIAQITPDTTLGTEPSIVAPNTTINGLPADLIQGGATRGANLFHSFSQFNVSDGQRVYFANPTGIENILSRVTGADPSRILGLLGVNGNANLFFLNPNGIIFGTNSRLDVVGSFVGTTASHFKFSDGSEFSATNPLAPPLLMVNVTPGLQIGVSLSEATIANRGQLTTGQDLTLSADRLDLQGQLQAGRDLTLQAQNTVQIRDTAASPFIATSGQHTAIQGNQSVDILALSHPQTNFQSGVNLSLISDGVISGDAHFRSGGDFQIKSLSGQLATFTSLYDPLISSSGNVDIAAGYSGASLLIESQGSVRIQGAVTINAPDTVSTFVGSDAILSTQPGLIIRSGQSSLVYGGTNQINPPIFIDSTIPAGITLDSPVRVQPNATGGTVKLTAGTGGITFHSIDASNQNGDNGGDIELTARGDITNTGSFSDPGSSLGSFNNPVANNPVALGTFSYPANGNNNGNGGNITLTSAVGNILLKDGESRSYSYSFSPSGNGGNGGAISFSATSGNISLTNSNSYSFSQSFAGSGNSGNGGAISFAATNGNISLTNSELSSYSDSFSVSGNGGNGGAIFLATLNGNISLTNSGLSSYSFSFSSLGNGGNGGVISLAATNGNISLTNSDADSYVEPIASLGNGGNGGAISFTATNGNISLTNSDSLSRSELGNGGNGGAISFAATNGNISLTNSDSLSGSELGNGGNGGAISFVVTNGNISLTNSNSDSTSSSPFSSSGNGGAISFAATNGNISLTNSRTATYGGTIFLSTTNGNIFLTNSNLYSFSLALSGNAGNGGEILLTAGNGNILGNGSVALYSFSVALNGASGQGGDVQLAAKNEISNLEILTQSSNGQAGTIQINGFGNLLIDNTQISTSKVVSIPNPFNSPFDPTDEFITFEVGKTGQSGAVTVNSLGDLTFNNTRVQSTTQGIDPAGSVQITSLGLLTFNNSQIISNTSSTGAAGSILVTAEEGVTLTGATSGLFAQTSSAGKAGTITLSTPQLTLQQGAQISTTATATSKNTDRVGSIILNASDIYLAGIVGVFAETQGQTPAGTLTLNPYNNQPTLNLTLAPQSQISASTSGSGNGGDLILTAPQAITIGGLGKLAVETTGTGNAGNINVTTQQLTLQDGVELSASTSSSGNAGNLTIAANSFDLLTGARVSTTTSGSGAAGNITLNIDDRLALSGRDTGLFATTAAGSTGNGGNITINPRTVLIQDRATIAVGSQGSGQGGNISIQASRLELSDRGSITAETASAQGGNITLNVQDILLLRRGSTISTTAGTAQAGGNGGNITINAPKGFIIGVKSENSDITANAFSGSGGRINITAQGIYGLQFRPRLTEFSDITASSTLGVSGIVTLNTPNVDPSRGLSQLPQNLIDTNRILANSCLVRDAASGGTFIITGTGGLPVRPGDAVLPTFATGEVRGIGEMGRGGEEGMGKTEIPNPGAKVGNVDTIAEAQGIYKLPDGQIILSWECQK